MPRQKSDTHYQHGPENAEHEIRKAYNCLIEASTSYFWKTPPPTPIDPLEMIQMYKHAFHCYRKGNRLAAERWARAAKHLSRAFFHESKIFYLEPRISELPYLDGAQDEEYNLYERSDTTADLLNSVAEHIPPGLLEMPREMKKYLSRGQNHLQVLEDPNYKHELLRVERIKAAHEYGRALECIALGHEAEQKGKSAAA